MKYTILLTVLTAFSFKAFAASDLEAASAKLEVLLKSRVLSCDVYDAQKKKRGSFDLSVEKNPNPLATIEAEELGSGKNPVQQLAVGPLIVFSFGEAKTAFLAIDARFHKPTAEEKDLDANCENASRGDFLEFKNKVPGSEESAMGKAVCCLNDA